MIPSLTSIVYLAKDGLFGERWAERFGTLNRGILRIYMTSQDFQPRNVINFDLVSCAIRIVKGCIFTLNPRGSSKTMKFKTASKQEFYEWALALQVYQVRSAGYAQQPSKITQFRLFWKKSFLSIPQAIEACSTLDLIFFAGHNLSDMALRLVSRSSFDEVGLLLKDESGNVFILESLTSVAA